MKKSKQGFSTDASKRTDKTRAKVKSQLNINAKTKVKKELKQNNHQQAIKIVDQKRQKNLKTPRTVAKNCPLKKNKRTVSMITDKGPITKFNTTHNSSQLAEQFAVIRKQQYEQVKQSTDISGLILSNRNLNHQRVISSIGEYSPFYDPSKRDYSTQMKHILIEDAEVQCQEFQTEQIKKTKAEISRLQFEKKKLQSNVVQLEKKIDQVVKAGQQKEFQMTNVYTDETNGYKKTIQVLTAKNKTLYQQNQSFKVIIKEQEGQIKIYQSTQEVLKERLNVEKSQKQRLVKKNDELKQQISFYKQELNSFENNLAEFQKMKNVYEDKLDKLQRQKIKIKKHACGLLEMVEKYKTQQED